MTEGEDNAGDELLRSISCIVEEFIRRMPGVGGKTVAGYVLVPRGPSKPPVIFRVIGDGDDRRLQYESIESDNFVYITVGLPKETESCAWVDITRDAVRIFIGERVATILLEHPADVVHSHYRVHRGVLDITLRKIDPAAR